MDHASAIGSWLLGEGAGKARMQADVDEPAIRLQDTAGLPGQIREVVDVSVGERRNDQRAGASPEREPSRVGPDEPGPHWPSPPPGHSELVG
jgi:hypothetical protein